VVAAPAADLAYEPICSSTRTSSRARSDDGLVEELNRAERERRWLAWPSSAALSRAVDYMKAGLVDSHRERWQRIDPGR